MAPGSLRTRLVVGSLLWTVGLVGAVNIITLFLVHRVRSLGLLHMALMTMIAIGLLASGLMQVRSGMAPLRRFQSGSRTPAAGSGSPAAASTCSASTRPTGAASRPPRSARPGSRCGRRARCC